MLHYYPDETWRLPHEACGARDWQYIYYVMKHHQASSMKTFVAAPTTTRTRPNAGSMLSHRLRRWPNIEPAPRVCWGGPQR